MNNRGKTISNKLEQKILKDLLNYNLSIACIAKDNGLSPETVRKIFEQARVIIRSILLICQEYYHLMNLKQILTVENILLF